MLEGGFFPPQVDNWDSSFVEWVEYKFYFIGILTLVPQADYDWLKCILETPVFVRCRQEKNYFYPVKGIKE